MNRKTKKSKKILSVPMTVPVEENKLSQHAVGNAHSCIEKEPYKDESSDRFSSRHMVLF